MAAEAPSDEDMPSFLSFYADLSHRMTETDILPIGVSSENFTHIFGSLYRGGFCIKAHRKSTFSEHSEIFLVLQKPIEKSVPLNASCMEGKPRGKSPALQKWVWRIYSEHGQHFGGLAELPSLGWQLNRRYTQPMITHRVPSLCNDIIIWPKWMQKKTPYYAPLWIPSDVLILEEYTSNWLTVIRQQKPQL